MKTRTTTVSVTAIVLALLATFVADVRANAQDYPTHESATRYLGNHPSKHEPAWADQMQGLASDRKENWFVTQKDKIWRIPVSVDLATPPHLIPEDVTYRGLGSDSELGGWNHFGDPDYLSIDDRDYLLVPMEKDDPNGYIEDWCGALAVFRADVPSLPLVTLQCIHNDTQRYKAPWVAVGPDRTLYTSHFDVLPVQDERPDQMTGINRYRVNWTALSNPTPVLEITPMLPLKPFDASGQPMELQNIQGGVVSPSGQLMFLSSDEMGVLVFRIEFDRLVLVARSCNAEPSASCRFSFQWDNTSAVDSAAQEPEGLDYWDLNDGRAPGIRGELHVGMIDGEWDWDDLYIKHYTAIQWVDSAATTTGNGKIGSPYRSLLSALAASWPGSIVRARGNHAFAPGSVVDAPGVRIEAWGSPATLGD